MKTFHKVLFCLSVFAALPAGLSACGGKTRVSTAEYIGIDAAKAAALSAAGVSADQAEFSSAGLDSKNGTFYYEVNFSKNGSEYLYVIYALTGVVIEAVHLDPGTSAETAEAQSEETPAEPSSAAETAPSGDAFSGSVSEEEARSAALAHAGVEESDLISIKTDKEHGEAVYEIKFRSADGTEYSYDILAADGSVLNYDYESHSSPSAPAPGSGVLSDSRIRQLVLDRVPGAPADQICLELDEDDGRLEYEGSLVYDGMEYEFKIDAYSGSILEWEADRM